MISGSASGVSTLADGSYSIQVAPGTKLTFQYIGYKAVEYTVPDSQPQVTYNLEMQSDTQALEDVVVIAYGVRKKGTIAGSVSTVKAEKIETVQKDEIKNNYAETFTYYCATRALMELEGFEFQTVFSDDAEKEAYDREYQTLYDECNAKLFTGGYRIYTSLDLEAQSRLQASTDYILGGFDEKNDEGIYTLQGASVCIDNTTGMVRAIVGGRSQDDVEGYTLNRAFQSFRQPGSAIKPLIVYTPALERGYTPDTIVVDEPIENGPVSYTHLTLPTNSLV